MRLDRSIKSLTDNKMAEINPTMCLARKASKGLGYHQQCPNKKKTGDYCGKHSKCLDNYVPTPIIQKNNIKDIIQEPTVIEIKEPAIIKVQNVELERKRYQNETDFVTLESIDLIPIEFLYEYLENDQYYAFDIRTLYNYVTSCNELEGIKNPFTHIDIPEDKLNHIKKCYKHLEKKGLELDEYKEDIKLDAHKKLEWRCLDIFQKIDQLGHYVDYRWFWNLNLYELKKMFFGLEDLWNYRLPITKHQKQRVLPNYTPFQIVTLTQYNSYVDINSARTVLLDEIEKFITMGKTEGKNGNDNKYIGSILVLTALVEVSKTAASVLPHLIPIL